jgi:ElaB/YqjD/DUF883 family membrane-anchored ribosome-binding protein
LGAWPRGSEIYTESRFRGGIDVAVQKVTQKAKETADKVKERTGQMMERQSRRVGEQGEKAQQKMQETGEKARHDDG